MKGNEKILTSGLIQAKKGKKELSFTELKKNTREKQ